MRGQVSERGSSFPLEALSEFPRSIQPQALLIRNLRIRAMPPGNPFQSRGRSPRFTIYSPARLASNEDDFNKDVVSANSVVRAHLEIAAPTGI
jgi:hypothetical protein